jgi:signal transduction histidine kinase
VALQRVGDRVELTVGDGGPGVAPAARASLFDPEAATPDGHGIGLPLARLLIDAEGGTLDLVDPERATFRIRLPAAPEPADSGKAGIVDGSPGNP